MNQQLFIKSLRAGMEAFIATLSQEPPLSTGVQPPVAATASVPVVETAPVAAATNPIDAQPSDDFGCDSSAPQSESEKVARELELVFAEYPQPQECVQYLMRKGMLQSGAGLETIKPQHAKKILERSKDFIRAVEAWVKGGRK